MSPGDEHDYGEPAGTRLRLPESDPYGGARRPARSSSRSMVTVVGVVVLLIAAIAFANRGDGDSGSTAATGADDSPKASSTAPTGTKPVDGKSAGIPTGYARTAQGAQSAAANYAVALGSTGMFRTDSRHTIVGTVYTAASAGRLRAPMDQAYSADFLAKLGLDAKGEAPAGNTFVSRVVPVGTTVRASSDSAAKVAVWYLGLIGMSGKTSTDPVTSSWKTWTFDLRWADGDWKIATDEQTEGPAPVPGDDKAAASDAISKAIEEYGGFTYAR